MMPEMDGYDVCSKVKKDSDLKDTSYNTSDSQGTGN